VVNRRFLCLLFLVVLTETGLFSLLDFPAPTTRSPEPPKPLRLALIPPSSPVVRQTVHKNISPPKKNPPVFHPHPVSKPVSHQPVPAHSPLPARDSGLLASTSTTPSASLGWGSGGTDNDGTWKNFTPPALLSEIDTTRLYTKKMKEFREEGDVVLTAWISPEGQLVRYEISVPSVYEDINQVVLRLLKTLRFRPAMSAGKAVSGEFQLHFRFRLQSG